MNGNIIGEQFDELLLLEIERRQSIHGSGLNQKRTPAQIQYLNNRNAWLKLASSVYVIGEDTRVDFATKDKGFEPKALDVNEDRVPDGIERLKAIGIQDVENFTGNQLAQKGVLFNTLSEVKFKPDGTFDRYESRSGVAKTNSLYNNSSYGLGGTNFGLSPAPGLIDCSIECINRGSIRKAKVTLKAYNKFQFDLIELLYLRLGYTMMLEWGFDKYIDTNGQLQHVGTTLIEDEFFKTAKVTQNSILQKIITYRKLYSYNYDGFFGKVTNFDWSFNPDGTYDISIDLITLGDVIESISAKNKVLALSANQIEDDTFTFFGYSSTPLGDLKDSAIVGTAGDSQISYYMYKLVRDLKWEDRKDGVSSNGPFFSWEHSREHYDGFFSGDYPSIDLPNYNYFMTLGQLLDILRDRIIPLIIKDNPELVLNIENDEITNICNTYPNLISLDPKVCLIKPEFYYGSESQIDELLIPKYLDDLKQFTFNSGPCYYGRVMNIYLNFEFIAEVLQQTDKKGDLSLFEFMTKIVTGINKALGNVIDLEVIVKDDNVLTIIDQNPIPNLGLDSPPSFEIFGYNMSGSSNFITDFSFETSITPDLASQISIGATAQGSSTRNTDATAFSKWNIGLMDRTNPSMVDTPGADFTNLGTEEQDNAWDNAPESAEFSTGEAVGSALFGGISLFRERTRNEVLNLVFTRNVKKDSFGIFGDNKKDNEQRNSELTIRKDVPYKGVTFENVTYYTFLTLAKTTDIALQVKEIISKAFAATSLGKAFSAIQAYFYDESEQFNSNYQLYLVRAFGGTVKVPMDNGDFKTITFDDDETLYTTMADDFVSEGHQSFNGYVNLQNEKIFVETGIPSNKAGFIPIKLGMTMEGLSGIKIYNGCQIRQDFLPPAYDKAVKFIIDKVDHSISDNNWQTSIGTLAVPNVQDTPKSPFTNMTYVGTEGGAYDIPANEGPIDPFNLKRDKPLKFIDNRTVSGKKVNDATYGKEISLETAVSYMNENIQYAFRNFYESLRDGGYDDYVITINAVFRPFSRSVELKAENPKNAAPGRSVHNYAAGVDFNVTDPKGRTFKKKERNPWIEQGIVAMAEKSGIKWGGSFSGYIDSVHFYVQFNRDVALSNAELDNPGKPQKDWDTQNTELENSQVKTFTYQGRFAKETITPERRTLKGGDPVRVTINYDDGEGGIAIGTGSALIKKVDRNQSRFIDLAIRKATLSAKGEITRILGS
jgi:hypothetical protein